MLSKWFHYWICIQLTFLYFSVASDGSNDSSLSLQNISDFYDKADAAYFQPTTISLLSQLWTIQKDLDLGFLFQFRGLKGKLEKLPPGQDLKKEFNLAIRTDTIRQIYNLFSVIEVKSIQWFWDFARQNQLESLETLFDDKNRDFQAQFVIYKINLWMDLFKNVESWGVGLNSDEESMRNFFQEQMDEFIKKSELPKGDEFRIFSEEQKKVSFNEGLFIEVNNKLPSVLVSGQGSSSKKDDDELRKNYKQLFNNTHTLFFQTIRDNKQRDNKIIFELTKLKSDKLLPLQTKLMAPIFVKLNAFFPKRQQLLKDIEGTLRDSVNSEKISIYKSTESLIGVIIDLIFIVEEDFILTVLNRGDQNIYGQFIKTLLEKTIPNLLKNKDVEKFVSNLPYVENIRRLEMLVFYKNLVEVPVDKKNYSKASGLFSTIVTEFQRSLVEEIKAMEAWSPLVAKMKASGGVVADNNVSGFHSSAPKFKLDINIDQSLKETVPAEKKTTNVFMAGLGVLLTLLKKTIKFFKDLATPKPQLTPQSAEIKEVIEASTLNKQPATA
jgi:hypothetical protein